MPAFLDYHRLGAGYALLWNSAANGGMHAYLLAGPKGVGKLTFARMLALRDFCTSVKKPCGICDACRRVVSGSEPDVMLLTPQDDKAIPIERVRQAIARISQHSFGSGNRFVIIEPVEKMTAAAQNCLLKSLEEPIANVVFLLITHEPSAVLGTIASRCAMVKLPPWPDEALTAALLSLGFEKAPVQACLPRAGGNIAQALTILAAGAQDSDAVALVHRALTVRSDADVVALSLQLKDDRAGAEQALTAIEQSLHIALLIRTGILPAQSVQDADTLSFSKHASESELTDLLTAVFQTRQRRQNQVNWQASIDRLLMKILEAKTRWQQS